MIRKSRFYIALLHYPMYNKNYDIITTSITNMDLHDISRVARTYAVDGFFIVHPEPGQHGLIKEIVSYWQVGFGAEYNPDRKEAFKLLQTFNSIVEVEQYIASQTGIKPLKIGTDARVYPKTITYKNMRDKIRDEPQAFLLLLGTGWGIARDLMDKCHYILEPIQAGSEYNHLSVRSAAAIILDRLLSN